MLLLASIVFLLGLLITKPSAQAREGETSDPQKIVSINEEGYVEILVKTYMKDFEDGELLSFPEKEFINESYIEIPGIPFPIQLHSFKDFTGDGQPLSGFWNDENAETRIPIRPGSEGESLLEIAKAMKTRTWSLSVNQPTSHFKKRHIDYDNTWYQIDFTLSDDYSQIESYKLYTMDLENSKLIPFDSDELSFHNTMKTVSLEFEGKVSVKSSVEGVEIDLTGREFEFLLLNDKNEEIGRAKSQADGSIIFPKVKFSDENPHQFTVKQVTNTMNPAIQYDDSSFTFTVQAKQAHTNDFKALEIKPYKIFKDNEEVEEISFTNIINQAKVTFDPNGGSGKMKETIVDVGSTYKLPQSDFTPPANKEFKSWKVKDREYQVGDSLVINSDTSVQAVWLNKEKPNPPVKPSDKDNVGGEDRIDTAIKVSERYFTKADFVVIARSDDFPDALTASVLAKAVNGPILLTKGDSISPDLEEELKRLGMKKIYIAGGDQAISDRVEHRLKKLADVERIGGRDRYETSVLIARKVVELTGNKGKATVTTGQDFADALSISPYAAKMGYPILLVKGDFVPEVVKTAAEELGKQGVFILGGEKAVSDHLKKDLPPVLLRIGGEDRYETSALIAERLFGDSKKAFLASGQVFSDALVIGPVAASENGPVLLTKKSSLPRVMKNHMEKANYQKIVIIGLEDAIQPSVRKELP